MSSDDFCVGHQAARGPVIDLGELDLGDPHFWEMGVEADLIVDVYTRSGGSTIAWECVATPGFMARCRKGTPPDSFVVEISAGALVRSWAVAAAVFTSRQLGRRLTIDEDVRHRSLNSQETMFRGLRLPPITRDLQLLLSEFATFDDLVEEARQMVSLCRLAAGKVSEEDALVAFQAGVVRATLRFLVFHELAHIRGGHFELRTRVSEEPVLSDFVHQGMEFDADWGAASMMFSWIGRPNETGPEHREWWKHTACAVTMAIFLIEVDRLRAVDAPLRDWIQRHPEAVSPDEVVAAAAKDPLPPTPSVGPHFYDAGRWGLVNAAWRAQLEDAPDSVKREAEEAGQEGVEWFADGGYLWVSGAIDSFAAQNGSLDAARMHMAGAVFRRFSEWGDEFRRLAVRRAHDGVRLLNWLRAVMDGQTDGSGEQVWRVIYPAVYRVMYWQWMQAHHRGEPDWDPEVVANELVEQFEVLATASAGSRFRACSSCGRQKLVAQACGYCGSRT